jgi:hypothetical protein
MTLHHGYGLSIKFFAKRRKDKPGIVAEFMGAYAACKKR